MAVRVDEGYYYYYYDFIRTQSTTVGNDISIE